jgi:hypothetical protein
MFFIALLVLRGFKVSAEKDKYGADLENRADIYYLKEERTQNRHKNNDHLIMKVKNLLSFLVSSITWALQY